MQLCMLQVNADVKKYVIENGIPRLFDVNTTKVGQNVSTKAVGSEKREDITHTVSLEYSLTINMHTPYMCSGDQWPNVTMATI